MADLLRLTETIATATATGDVQPLYTALDVLAYDALDLLVTATFETPSSPSLSLDIISGMQTTSEDGWISVGSTSSPLTLAAPAIAWSFNAGFFRYIRWKVKLLSGAAVAKFTIEVVGRSND